MVHQFKFSEGKTKGSFNNTISHYIKNLRAAFNDPPVTQDKLDETEAYFNRILKNLDVKPIKRKTKKFQR